VICVGMRPGPATGMATRTAQADLFATIYAGHGEFARAVLTPADALGAFQAVQDAFYLADRYQTPSILLFDQFLGDALWTVPQSGFSYRAKPVSPAAIPAVAFSYERYAASEDGVSPRLAPGTPGQLVYVDSDEHSAAGHIAESAQVRTDQVRKRGAKQLGVAAEAAMPVQWPAAKVDTLVVCFGSTRGIVREAVQRLRGRGASVGMVHLEQVWPFPSRVLAGLAEGARRVVTVEGNATGQLAQLVTQECRLRVDGVVRRYDGRQFRVGEVEAGLAGLIAENNEA
jgi:2-oxoglutarate/2-oxoacid ferredoxin oxidoreductase subunit alpha